MGNRRKAREAALQLLYPIDLGKFSPQELFPLFWKNQAEEEGTRDFTEHLVLGVTHNLKEIDELLEKHSTHWKLSRMSIVDRNILRMAVYEILYCEDIPKSVTLNEAIDIGKKFGTEDSGAFINGVLDNLAKGVKN
ncbi:MAG: transcription antitermination factor NusB [Deltaproteobacteria bacterium]|nr:transcription antitermination factor NusB [Deltaproteobacteria bacterium]